jgi:hypothetical protein
MRPLRNPMVLRLLVWLTAGYLRFALRSIRWRYEGAEHAEAVWDSGGGTILCVWHSRTVIAPVIWPLDRAQPARLLISQSSDGEFIARVMQHFGFSAARGSRSKSTDPAKGKGGAAAFRDLLKWVRDGRAVAITPDGPRGPAEVMPEGPVVLAGITGVPVLLCGMACRPCLRLKTWDRTVIPLPFGRGAVSWEPAMTVAKTSDAAAIEAVRTEWASRLTAANTRAEALVA